MPSPPPPPPPRKLSKSPSSNSIEVPNDHFQLSVNTHLPSDEEEIKKLITRNQLQEAKIIHFCHVEPILQVGPQCGLVALAMASQEIPRYMKPVLVNQILAEARVRGLTQHGEVYSVDFMSELVSGFLPFHRSEILLDLQSYPDSLSHALCGLGAMVLIPYDSDFNHAPCLKRGHKAHWALLVGLISSKQGYYVLARHGKSRHLACWSLLDLIKSNNNLEEEGAARHDGGYVIPKGGVGGQRGLRGRALAIYHFG